VRGLIGVLTKMRRAWGEFEDDPDGDLFAIAPGPGRGRASPTKQARRGHDWRPRHGFTFL
jgi:hypothetical protein